MITEPDDAPAVQGSEEFLLWQLRRLSESLRKESRYELERTKERGPMRQVAKRFDDFARAATRIERELSVYRDRRLEAFQVIEAAFNTNKE